MKFKKKIKLGYPRKAKKKFIKSQGRSFYKLRTSRLVRAIMKTQDRRILPSLLTIDTNPDSDLIQKKYLIGVLNIKYYSTLNKKQYNYGKR